MGEDMREIRVKLRKEPNSDPSRAGFCVTVPKKILKRLTEEHWVDGWNIEKLLKKRLLICNFDGRGRLFFSPTDDSIFFQSMQRDSKKKYGDAAKGGVEMAYVVRVYRKKSISDLKEEIAKMDAAIQRDQENIRRCREWKNIIKSIVRDKGAS